MRILDKNLSYDSMYLVPKEIYSAVLNCVDESQKKKMNIYNSYDTGFKSKNIEEDRSLKTNTTFSVPAQEQTFSVGREDHSTPHPNVSDRKKLHVPPVTPIAMGDVEKNEQIVETQQELEAKKDDTALARPIRKKMKSKRFQCFMCESDFVSRLELTKHMHTTHGTSRSLTLKHSTPSRSPKTRKPLPREAKKKNKKESEFPLW